MKVLGPILVKNQGLRGVRKKVYFFLHFDPKYICGGYTLPLTEANTIQYEKYKSLRQYVTSNDHFSTNMQFLDSTQGLSMIILKHNISELLPKESENVIDLFALGKNKIYVRLA